MLTESPLVSIIIPYFNSGNTIQETIDSIFNQSYENFDVWIINDGSTDLFSIEKLRDFEGIKKINILTQQNLGPSSARNNAIVKSQAEFFVFLDADDLIEAQTLDFALKNIASNDILFGDCKYFGSRNDVKKQILPTKEQILVGNPIAICAIVRAEILKEILFDPRLDKLGLEDWELWINLFSKDYKFIYFEEILFKIRVSANSRTFKVANEKHSIIKKYIFNKHSDFLYSQYLKVFLEKKELSTLIDFKIGKLVLCPYRMVKQIFKK